MKKIITLMGIVLAGSYALAQDTSPATDPYGGSSSSGKAPASASDTASQQQKPKAKVTAEVIAADETSKTITVRPVVAGQSAGSSLESVTLPVEGKALASLKSIKTGERVSLTCREQASSSMSGSSGAGSSSSGSAGSSSAGSAGSAGSMGASAPSALSTSSCNSVTEISKVKASSQSEPSGDTR